MSNQKILTEISIYPIKSLPGFRVRSARVLEKGLEDDRRYMLIDENNMFMTQRIFSQMALFEVSMESKVIRVKPKNSGQDAIHIQPDLTGAEVMKAVVWDSVVEVVEVNPVYSRWFSDALGVSCKLVFFPEVNKRRVNPDYVKDERNVSLADGYPFLIIGRNSLGDLNQKMGLNFPMKRFRPNFVFDGGEPYEEDGWKVFKIGNNLFEGVKPCSRCVITTVDPETGLRGTEPLSTLASYRKRENNIYFGQNVIALNHNEIHEGDEIVLL